MSTWAFLGTDRPSGMTFKEMNVSANRALSSENSAQSGLKLNWQTVFNELTQLDLHSIMSSPRTGILSLIRFNSGQE